MAKSQNKRPLNSLADDELRRYCAVSCNLPAEQTTDRAKMTAALGLIGKKMDDLVEVPEVVNVGVTSDAAKPDSDQEPIDDKESIKRGEQVIEIVVQASEEAGGGEPVPVSVNGSAIWIPRGVPVRVKRKFADALNLAIRTVYDPDPGPLGGTLPPRDVRQYPYSVHHDPHRSAA